MERRAFLKKSVEASLLAFLPAGVASAARQVKAVPISADLLPGLNPVSSYLQSYAPPEGVLAPDRAQRLVFDVVGWKTDKSRKAPTSPILGEVSVVRTPSSGGTRYEVAMRNGENETLTGTLRCGTDPWRPLKSWEYLHALDAGAPNLSALTQTRCAGKCADGKLTLRQDGAESVQEIAGPVLCRCGLIDAAPSFVDLCERGGVFAVLEVPSGLRRDQTLAEDESGKLPDSGTTPIRTFLQTGPATLPTHWIVDASGRPLFITAFLTSWALKAIE